MKQFIRRWFAIPLFLSGVAVSGIGISAAEAQQPASKDVQLRTARFWRGEGRTLLEGVVGLPVATMNRSVELTVRDSTGKTLHSESWSDSATADAGALAALHAETATKLELLLSPGSYMIAVRRTEGSKVDSATAQIRGFPETPVLSDVVLSARMRVLAEKEEPTPAEMKRGRYAIERGARVMVLPHEPRLWYYVELYRQGADSVAQLNFRVVPVGASDSALVRVTRQVAVGSGGTVDAAALVVQGLPPGQYRLVVTASSGGRQETRESPFVMGTWENVPATTAAPGGTASESALMDRYFTLAVRPDADINLMVEALTVSAPGEAVSEASIAGLTTDAKRRYLARYWSRIPDPKPETPQHEVLDEYAERVRYVNAMFSEGQGRSAVRTDRGRIYIRFGQPDARQQVQMGNNRSVDIWKYTRRRTIKVAFLDETGFGNYNMVYASGDPTLVSLADWADRIGRTERDAINTILNF
ncbi:MAG TPA: GWxTD domain-containing protein [Longimicrobiales bacterium]|nr:GWxTD domain-containing protein [Longimicrobiales bacterium]